MQFNAVTMEIPDLEPSVELHAMKSGLKVGFFADSLAINKQKTIADFREKAVEFIEMEELIKARRAERKAN